MAFCRADAAVAGGITVWSAAGTVLDADSVAGEAVGRDAAGIAFNCEIVAGDDLDVCGYRGADGALVGEAASTVTGDVAGRHTADTVLGDVVAGVSVFNIGGDSVVDTGKGCHGAWRMRWGNDEMTIAD